LKGDTEAAVRKGGGTDYSRRATEDTMVATSLISLLIQLFPSEMHTSMLPLFSIMAATVCYRPVPPMGKPAFPSKESTLASLEGIPRELQTLMGTFSESLFYLFYRNPRLLPMVAQGMARIDSSLGDSYKCARLLDGMLVASEPAVAEGETEDWKQKEQEAVEAELNAIGPKVPNMRYDLVPLRDSDGLSRQRRFFSAISCSVILCCQLNDEKQVAGGNAPLKLSLWDPSTGKGTSLLKNIFNVLLDANEDRHQINRDRKSVESAVDDSQMQVPLETFGARKEERLQPRDETTRLRLQLSMQDQLWNANVPSAIQETVRLLLESPNSPVRNLEDLLQALDLYGDRARTLASICNGEQQRRDASSGAN